MADFAGGVLNALAAYLKAEMPSITQVLTEWPGGSFPLTMPSLTLITEGTADLTPMSPSLMKVGTPIPPLNVTSLNLYTVGQYELKIQADMWARNKPERQKIQQEFFNALYKNVEPPGIHLVLTDYFDVLCTYWPLGYRNVDSEESTQRQEWRATFTIDVMAAAVAERTDAIMVTTTVELETHTEIAAEGV